MTQTTAATVVSLSITAAACLSACAPAAQEGGAEPPAPVAVGGLARVEVSDIPETFEVGGVLQPDLTATISSRVVSQIVDVQVRAGDRVRKGQTLVVLDAREIRAQGDRARAAQTAAGESSKAAAAEQQGARAALDLARATHARVERLRATGSATPQELDDAVGGLRAAEARDAAARARVAEVAAAIDVASAGAESAAVAESYCRLTAPFAGVIAERFVDPGVVAAPGLPLLSLENTSGFRLVVRLDEARAAHIARGQTADVRLDAAGTWRTGRVLELSRVDPLRHAFEAKVELPDDGTLRSGLFGRARFASGSHRALTIPAGALVRRGQLTFAFVADADGRARLRAISAGQVVGGDRLEVHAGLVEGESVVVAPPPSLVDGALISNGKRP